MRALSRLHTSSDTGSESPLPDHARWAALHTFEALSETRAHGAGWQGWRGLTHRVLHVHGQHPHAQEEPQAQACVQRCKCGAPAGSLENVCVQACQEGALLL